MLLYKTGPLKSGYNRIVSPENAPLKHLEFGRVLLEAHQAAKFSMDGREAALCLLSGSCEAECQGTGAACLTPTRLGPRTDAFDPTPWCLYLPRQISIGHGPVERVGGHDRELVLGEHALSNLAGMQDITIDTQVGQLTVPAPRVVAIGGVCLPIVDGMLQHIGRQGKDNGCFLRELARTGDFPDLGKEVQPAFERRLLIDRPTVIAAAVIEAAVPIEIQVRGPGSEGGGNDLRRTDHIIDIAT